MYFIVEVDLLFYLFVSFSQKSIRCVDVLRAVQSECEVEQYRWTSLMTFDEPGTAETGVTGLMHSVLILINVIAFTMHQVNRNLYLLQTETFNN